MVRLAHYMGIVHPGGAFEVSTTSIQVAMFVHCPQYLIPGLEAKIPKILNDLPGFTQTIMEYG